MGKRRAPRRLLTSFTFSFDLKRCFDTCVSVLSGRRLLCACWLLHRQLLNLIRVNLKSTAVGSSSLSSAEACRRDLLLSLVVDKMTTRHGRRDGVWQTSLAAAALMVLVASFTGSVQGRWAYVVDIRPRNMSHVRRYWLLMTIAHSRSHYCRLDAAAAAAN